MPWLYYSLKPKNRVWAEEMAAEYQAYFMEWKLLKSVKLFYFTISAYIC
jgi:hypothetical protein